MNRKIISFLMAYLASLVIVSNFQVIPPLIPFIIKDWGITRAQSGLLMGITALPPMLFGIVGGYILDRFGNKLPMTVSLIIYLLGQTLFIIADNFTLLLLSRVIVGFGGIIFGMVGLRILAEEFQGGNLGKAIGFWGTGMPVAVLISFNLFSFIAERFSWKTPMIILRIFTLFILLMIIFLYKERRMEVDSNIEFLSSLKSMPKEVWLLSVMWFLFNAGSLSFLTFAPDYLVSRGLSSTQASSISSLYMLGAFLSPIIGYILDKTTRPNLMVFGGAVLLSIILMSIYLINSPTMIIIAGILAALIPPCVFYLLPRLTDKFGLGYSILSVSFNLGTFFSPYIIGYAKDISGSYFASFLLMSVFIAISGLLILRLKAEDYSLSR